MWGRLLTALSGDSGTSLLGVCFTHGGGWDFCTDMWVWIFHADFLVRIFVCGFLGADFWVRILGCGSFRGFCDGLCGFWGADFFSGFFGCFPAEKALKKSHHKIPPKSPHQRSSPRSISSQYATTLLLANTADLLRTSGCRCTLWRTIFSAQMASVREDERAISA